MPSRHPDRYKELLERLRAARREAGITQVEVSARLRTTQQWISKVELGERRIDPIELCELARLYGKPVSFFLPDAP